MDAILKPLVDLGSMGILAAALLYLVITLQRRINDTHDKLMGIIEKNTTAFDGLKATIDKCQLLHEEGECSNLSP